MKKKLKEICVFYSGTGFPTQYQGEIEGEYPFYKVGDIANNVTAGKKYLELCKNYISPDVAKTIKGCILPKDTVVFAKIGEALKLNRRAITSCDCLIDNNAMGIAPNGEYLRIQYFYFFMKNLKMQSLAESTTVPSVRKTKLEDYEIEVPSLDEQEEIEAKLSLTAEIIKKEKEELKKLDDLIKARFVEMFGNESKRVAVSSVCDVSGGYSFKSGDISSNGVVKILQIGNVYLDDLNWETTNYLPEGFDYAYSGFLLNEGDVVIALTRPIIKALGNVKACIVKESDMPCLLNQRVGRIVPKQNVDVSMKFVYRCFMTNDFTRYVESCCIGCSQPNISTKDIENYMIPDVSYAEQMAFVKFIDRIDKSKLMFQKLHQ